MRGSGRYRTRPNICSSIRSSSSSGNRSSGNGEAVWRLGVEQAQDNG